MRAGNSGWHHVQNILDRHRAGSSSSSATHLILPDYCLQHRTKNTTTKAAPPNDSETLSTTSRPYTPRSSTQVEPTCRATNDPLRSNSMEENNEPSSFPPDGAEIATHGREVCRKTSSTSCHHDGRETLLSTFRNARRITTDERETLRKLRSTSWDRTENSPSNHSTSCQPIPLRKKP